MVAVTELGYVCFGVSDLAAWRDFAGNLLGLEVFEEPGEPDRLYLRTDYWHHRIIVEKNPADDLLAAGLRVAGVEEFNAMQKVLKERGRRVRDRRQGLCEVAPRARDHEAVGPRR